MKLKKLVIQGFKSFKDRTIIHFDQGITGIVGPNGCGKSNIVDALFWVMGEQSAKHLRGSSMKDVIFSGSEKYAPGPFAEVSLILENSFGKSIHIGDKMATPPEIQLTRKLYRDGESEYRLNDQICRLRDIQEVFMDTGVGAKSYSIIAQGEINRLVQAGPQDKRVMIEEVAGITKFKLRKKESLKKIEQTQQNFNRIQDLKNEIHKRLKQLEGQAEKAEKAKVLKEKIERHELIVESHRELEFLQKFKDFSEEIFRFQEELETARATKNRADLELQQEKIKQSEILVQVDELQKQYNEKAKELAKGEERYRYLQQSRQEKIKLSDSRQKESHELQKEVDLQKNKLGQCQLELEKLEGDQPEDSELFLLQEKLSILKEEVEYKETTLRELRQEVEAAIDKRRKVEQLQLKNQTLGQEEALRLEEINERLDWLEGEMSNRSQNILLEQVAVQDLSKRQKEVELSLSTLQQQLKDQQNINIKTQGELKEINLQKARCLARRQTLEELEVSSVGKEGPHLGDFLHSPEGKEFHFLAEIIQHEPTYTKALQLLFGPLLTSLISKESGKTLFLWAQEKGGEAYYTSTLRDQEGSASPLVTYLKEQGVANAHSLMELIQLPDAYRHFAPLFKKGVVVDAINWEVVESVQQNFKGPWAIVTVDGRFWASCDGDSLHWQWVNDQDDQGPLVRQLERNRLQEEISQLTSKGTLLESHIPQWETEITQRKKQRDEWQRELSEIYAQLQVKQKNVQQLEQSLEKERIRSEQLKSRKEELSLSRLQSLEEEEKLTQQLEEQEEQVVDKKAIIVEMDEEWQIKRSSYEELREEVLERETYLKTYQIRYKTVSNQLEDLKHSVEKLQTRLTQNEALIEEYNREVVDGLILIEKLKEINQQLIRDMSEQEKVLKEGKRTAEETGKRVLELEKELKNAHQIINRGEKETLVNKTKMEQILIEEEQCVRNIFEKYQVNLRTVTAGFLQLGEELINSFNNLTSMYWMETGEGAKELVEKEFNFVRKYGQDLQNITQNWRRYQRELVQLGEINWMAVEEYVQQKKRYTFLCEQEQQLQSSLSDLQSAIGHIDEKSKERFKTAFNAVQEQFSFVFPVLFGGGHARLELLGNWEDPDAGVEIVAGPPGKKIQNINLMSGGEKALTAVSLIFATFMVRPSPFCLLDEVDAPLDDANVGRFNNMLRNMVQKSQFILITHNKKTMELNDVLYGVTMEEPGISKAVSVRLQ